MDGKDVNELQNLENRGKEDEGKSAGHLSAKLTIMSVALHNMECAHLPPEPDTGERYSWIPFPCNNFVDLILEGFFLSGQDRSKMFLEIGCGIGTKVMLADVLFEAHGFDVVEEYLELARRLGCKRVFQSDMMLYENFSDFDLLYFYAGSKEVELQREFENRIHQQMKVGALLAPMHTSMNWNKMPGMKKAGNFWYIKEEQCGVI